MQEDEQMQVYLARKKYRNNMKQLQTTFPFDTNYRKLGSDAEALKLLLIKTSAFLKELIQQQKMMEGTTLALSD
jgi:hypothetical protein